MATAEALMTAEEFGQMPDNGRRTELVQGRIIELPQPGFLHGLICVQISSLMAVHVRQHDLGRVVSNDSGIVTRRDPDSVRGADVAFYSFGRLPKGTTPSLYPEVAPELVVEVRSPSERWRDVHAKVAEYLALGVLVVCVLDPEPRSAHLYYPDQPNRTLGPEDELSVPECLGDFRVGVGRLFD